ncbi:hypothetical protein DFH27DRAFT_525313 [Peziza echinospora]|nr:hypothetical protein DFH27DRAFT_525313 [Peziza echinospora]
MPTSAFLMCPETISIKPGPTWKPLRPQDDIKRLLFRAWTAQGQIVQGVPNGNFFYIHNGHPFLYQMNLLWNGSIPVGEHPETHTAVLACDHDLIPRTGPIEILTWETSFPQDPVLRTIGGPLDIQIRGGFQPGNMDRLDSAKKTSKARASSGKNARGVNAWIAYRCLYAPHVPLGRQMDVSGIIRRMWANEPADVRRKFTQAGAAFTAERDQLFQNGQACISLTQFMQRNLQRFGINAPRTDFITTFMEFPQLDVVSNMRDYILDEYIPNDAEFEDSQIDNDEADLLEKFCARIDEREGHSDPLDGLFENYFAEYPRHPFNPANQFNLSSQQVEFMQQLEIDPYQEYNNESDNYGFGFPSVEGVQPLFQAY